MARTLPPVEAFGQLPEISAAKFSPDGQHFAAVQAFRGKEAVVVYCVGPTEDTKPTVLPSDAWRVRSIRWVKNDRLVVLLGQNKKVAWDASNMIQSWTRAIAISPDGTGSTMLLQDNPSLGYNYGTGPIVDVDLADPDNIFMPLWAVVDTPAPNDEAVGGRTIDDDRNDLFKYDLFKVDVRTGNSERVTSGGRDASEWYMDGDGRIVARVDETRQPLVDHLLLYQDDKWHEIGAVDADGDSGAGVEGLTEDGKALVLRSRDPQSMTTLTKMDLDSRKESVLFGNAAFDVDEARVDEWTQRVVGASYESDGPTDVYFDARREALQRGLEAAFPGLSVRAVSSDLAEDRLLVRVEGPRSPPTYYFLDRTSHQATNIASAYPELDAADLGEMKAYAYKARDGLVIPAYLTLPPGELAKNLPAIVMPHGGPDSRDGLGFDWQAQFLANRDYAVLQPNYRGSSGYGHKFTQAGLHQWGLKMQDDITDGVRKLIADRIADPKRVCIVGASYGGYAALAGAAFTPDLYACAVSVSGVSDLPAMIRNERSRYGKSSGALSFWISMIGSPDDDSDQLRATSPARHADQVKCPVLLMHGDGDTTVPIGQSELMYDAMKNAGKSVEFVKLEGDDHYLTLAASRIRMLSEVERFLAAHLSGTPVAQK